MASRGKKDGKTKTPAKPGAKPSAIPDDAAAARRVALLRKKLTRAMEDPLMREQIVRAIRTVMKDG